MPSNEIQPVSKGQPISADAYNALIAECKRANKIFAAAPLQVAQIPGGQLLTINAPDVVLIGKAPEEIDAMTGDTPGSGTVNIWNFTTSGDVAVTDPLVSVTAINLSSQPVAADTMLQLKRHTSGRLLIDFESCEE